MFMKKITWLLLILLVSLSCNKKDKPDVWKDVLSHKDMVKLIAEVHIIEALVEERRNTGKLKPGELKLFYDQLFTKYKINNDLFFKNINYYLERPEEFLKIYEEVITELSKRQGAAKFPK